MLSIFGIMKKKKKKKERNKLFTLSMLLKLTVLCSVSLQLVFQY